MKIAFSGAGAYGISYIGIVKALTEQGIVPKELAGTSMGAIIASWWSAGLTWEEMAQKVENIKKWWFWSLDFWEVEDILENGGLVDPEIVMEQLFKHTLPPKWEYFKIPLHVITTNLTRKEYEDFSLQNQKLTPAEAVYASMAIPGAFRALRRGGDVYVDGGIVNNEPVDVLGDNAVLIVPTKPQENPGTPNGIIEIGESIIETIIKDVTLSDLHVRYFMVESGWKGIKHFLDFENVNENIEIGYKNGIEFIKEYNYAE